MTDVQLLGYKICKISMLDKIPEPGPLQLKNNIKFNIDYASDNESATATLLSCIENRKEPSMFFLNLEIQAIFALQGIKNMDAKEEANLKCYDELFYYLEEITAYLMANTGMEGFKLRKPAIIPQKTDSGTSKSNCENSGEIIEFRTDL